jgi:hypothetical protein
MLSGENPRVAGSISTLAASSIVRASGVGGWPGDVAFGALTAYFIGHVAYR